ncbi:MAG TPA: choice-of-anchor tandem repeat GloVer-containing protein, partial [Chryseolinea sp.]|nr:choice-of-anchor tandem repeat GloVer-containing protein [Chryseolinea sp.]
MTKSFVISLGRHLMVGCFLMCGAFSSSAQQMLWGAASEGGAYGPGVIFKTNVDGSSLEVKKSLQAIPGRSPLYGRLIQASNGKLYGMTFQGGGALKGALFEYDPVA